MVDINLTLFVIFCMFVVFLWAMNTFVFRPLLEVMDKRDEKIASDQERADTEAQAAGQIELAYASKVAALHRDENRKIRQAHWDAQAAHNTRVGELKERENLELEALRLDALRQIEVQREDYPPLVKALVKDASGRLSLQGGEG
ncbi:MAG: ATP synthase F0 subunit B [Proteobacteria bacterium]|nr:ATP synthase F0 subunit B [Pseudomonadota bacterium]